MNPTSTTASSQKHRTILSCTRNSTVYIVNDQLTSKKPEVLKILPLRRHNEAEVKNQQFAATLSKDVVEVYSGQRISNEFHIWMACCPGGALSSAICKRAKCNLPWAIQELYSHALSLTKLMSVLHAKQVTHRDIKPDNIFLESDASLKLGDFGCSNWGPSEVAELHGTLLYMPPELYYWNKRVVCYKKVDSFSLGKTIYEMATLQLMEEFFSTYEDESQYNTHLNSVLKSVNATLGTVIQGLMAFNPAKRWNCADAYDFLLSHKPEQPTPLGESEPPEESTRSSEMPEYSKVESFLNMPEVEISLSEL